MLERACFAVEQAADGGGVFPEVLFDVARHWYEMSEEASPTISHEGSDHSRLQGDITMPRQDTGSPGMLSAAAVVASQVVYLCFSI